MPEKPQPKVAPKSTSGAARRPLGLTDQWHGLPVYAWVGIGAVTAAGAYLFIRRYRAAKTAPATEPSAIPTGSDFGSAPLTPAPPVVLPPAKNPPGPKPAKPPKADHPVVATPPHVRQYTTQDVLDIFARYNKPLNATQGPTTETVAQRIARLVRELNDGTRTPDDIARSVQALPGSGYQAPSWAATSATPSVASGSTSSDSSGGGGLGGSYGGVGGALVGSAPGGYGGGLGMR